MIGEVRPFRSRPSVAMLWFLKKRGLPAAHYHRPVSGQRVPGGVVHKLPADLRKALIANATALDAWKDITPLARNEFICWVEDASRRPPESAAFGGRRRAGGRPAPALLLAGVRAPRSHRQAAAA